MDKLVFLDIDGVVNSGKNYHEWNAAWQASYADRTAAGLETDKWAAGYDGNDPHVLKLFDADNIAVLNRITQESGAKIVISSSWRMFYGTTKFQKLRDTLAAAGVTAEVVAPTPVHIPQRGQAIDQYLYANYKDRSCNLVILDDEGQESFTRNNKNWLVQTDGRCGLQPKDATKALRVLNGRRYKGRYA